ncbi:MAG TPA: cytochrome c3 family protein [Tepidisphaeraceae bacterium]|nr:cytochrome c3 family protein [Tepidisphaeraceae bacterium]
MSESQHSSSSKYMFPRWANYLLPGIIIAVVGGALYVPLLFGFGGSAKTLAVGYQPIQPVPYSHALHAGKLGIDCRYCHYTVERAAFAAIPPTQVCMNCHTNIKTESEKLKPIRDSWISGKPVTWTKVHDLPDYVYFNHSAHVNHGVGCVTCHGRIDQMEVVQQAKPLSMSWCLECHREPEKFIRPKDQITNMDYKPAGDQIAIGLELKQKYGIHDAIYMQSCYTCHR